MSRVMSEADYASHQAKRGRARAQSNKTELVSLADIFGGVAKPVKKAKYGNIKTADAHSLKESRRMNTLRVIQTAGVISNLAFQVRYPLIPKQQMADGSHERAVTYTCDAQYIENGKLVVEDTKSAATRKLPAYIHKRKAMLHLYGIEIKEI